MYFESFISECLRDLKNNGSTCVFYDYQVEEIKKTFPNIKVEDNNGYFNIKLVTDKQETACTV